MHYRSVIWDWNGTLADDVEASLLATNDILKDYGKPPITMEQYYRYMDTPISRFYSHLFDLSEVTMEQIGLAFAAYYPRYFDRLHTGAEALLRKIQASGIPQIILSSSHRDAVERDILRFGIRDCFTEIVAADDQLAAGKAERGQQWLASQEIPPEYMVVIGDTLHDNEKDCSMGTDCILCAIGHQCESDLRTAGVPVVTDFSQLESLLWKMPSGR